MRTISLHPAMQWLVCRGWKFRENRMNTATRGSQGTSTGPATLAGLIGLAAVLAAAAGCGGTELPAPTFTEDAAASGPSSIGDGSSAPTTPDGEAPAP